MKQIEADVAAVRNISGFGRCAKALVRNYFVTQLSEVDLPLKRMRQNYTAHSKPSPNSRGRKAMGLHSFCAELLNGQAALCMIISDFINNSIANGDELKLGVGKLTMLQKTKKPAWPVKNIRPILLAQASF